jgi:adenine-specific DNA-methyltransferase
MSGTLNKLIDVLKQDERLVIDGKLAKNKIVELALDLDVDLLKLLKKSKDLAKIFFQELDGVLIFDKIKFQSFVSNKQFLPGSFTEYKNKIGLVANQQYLSDSNEVVLAFPYKDCVLEGGQDKDDTKRDEVFWNETLAPDEIDRLLKPKVLTNIKKYTADGEQEIDEIKDTNNLIIKGNNLIAMHSLKSAYQNKVKFIYIDPPYNTTKDTFNYNDRFNHSTWLVFMKNRLEIAKKLLAKNGVIAISCDDNEQAYLKVLCDNIFHKENFVTTFYVQVRYKNKTLSEDNDYQKVMECIHVYAKDNSIFKPNKIKEAYSLDKFCHKITELSKGSIENIAGKKVEIFKEDDYKIEKIDGQIDGLKETWATGSLIRQGGTASEFLALHLIDRKKQDGLKVLYKVYGMGADGLGYRYISGPRKASAFRGKFYSGVPLAIKDDVISGNYSKEKPIPNILYNFLDYSAEFGNCRGEGGVDMGGGKKPEALIRYLVEYFTNKGDLILDFFAGSGTTGAVAHKMHRKYILIEQMDYIHDLPEFRLKNVINGDKTGISNEIGWKGGGSFVYAELAKANQNFIDAIQNAKKTEELGVIWEEMKAVAFLSYKIDIAEIDKTKSEWADLSLDDQKRFLIEVLEKNWLYVPYSEINDERFNIPENVKKLNRKFYE